MQGGYKRASRHHPGSNRFLKRDDVAGPGGAAVIAASACSELALAYFALLFARGREGAATEPAHHLHFNVGKQHQDAGAEGCYGGTDRNG